MQDRYVGDIGDFGKFHMLRSLFNNSNYNLKQIWYLYPDENHNSDGMYIDYFEKIKDCDTKLEESLKKLLKGKRSVKALEKEKLLNNCHYFSKCINENGKDNLEFRKSWFNEVLTFSKDSDFIFVDPDNGIATKVDKIKKDIEFLGFDTFSKKTKAGKYIFFDEIDSLYNTTKCLVVYHHLNRTMPHNKQIEIIKKNLENNFHKVIALKHKPYSPRVYFFLFNTKEIEEFLLDRLNSFHKNFTFHWELFH